MLSLSPSQLTFGGLGGISAGACVATEADAVLGLDRLSLSTFEGCCAPTRRAVNIMMAAINLAASFPAPVMHHLKASSAAEPVDRPQSSQSSVDSSILCQSLPQACRYSHAPHRSMD